MNDPASPTEILSSVPGAEETAYVWDIATDRMSWEPNATAVLGLNSNAALTTGTAFATNMTANHAAKWHSGIFATAATDSPQGTPYHVQYTLDVPGSGPRDPVWIDDRGHWWPGPDGRPARARGVVRVVLERRTTGARAEVAYTGPAKDLDSVLLAEALASTITRTERTHQTSAFLVVAVNNLSALNTSFGRAIGDELIEAVGRFLKSLIRTGNLLGTFASNKFGIILGDCGLPAARMTAERLIDAVRNETFTTSACSLTAGISIGVAMIPAEAKTVAEAMSNALDALEHAQAHPSGGYEVFVLDPSQDTKRQRNIAVAAAVLSALENDRLRLVLQPIVSAETGEPVMYECLLRMIRSDGSLAAAGEFIPMAESLGMAHRIDLRTLELAVALLKQHPELRLALNVSGFTANDHGWVVALHRLTGGRREIAQRLTIEITETALVDDIGQTAAFVDIIRGLGCEISIDDFGAGYTSFRQLKTLKIDVLKIDGAFVKDLPNDHQGRLLIKAIVEMANAFGLRTVAEWVGDAATAAFLRDAGVTYLQGFHYGLPISVEELATLQSAR